MSSGFDPVPSDRLEITNERGSALTDFDYRVAASLLKLTNSLQLPKDTLGYLVEHLSLNQPMIPVSQLSGFTQFTAQAAPTIGGAAETTTSASFTTLTTTGPILTGLPNGKYLVLFGALMRTTPADGSYFAYMGIRVNTTDPDVADAAETSARDWVNSVFVITTTLSSGDNNTLEARYRTDAGGTGYFGQRWLVALKYSEI